MGHERSCFNGWTAILNAAFKVLDFEGPTVPQPWLSRGFPFYPLNVKLLAGDLMRTAQARKSLQDSGHQHELL